MKMFSIKIGSVLKNLTASGGLETLQPCTEMYPCLNLNGYFKTNTYRGTVLDAQHCLVIS